VPLVKEILTTVPLVLLTEPVSHTVMNVHMDSMITVLILTVKFVDKDSHTVSDVTKTNVLNVMPVEVLQIVDVSLDQLMLHKLLMKSVVTYNVTDVHSDVSTVSILKPTVLKDVLTKLDQLSQNVLVEMELSKLLTTQNVTLVLSDVPPVQEFMIDVKLVHI
jgi:hypothetical protein